MAIYRHVHVEFWKDPKVLEELTPEDKLFFIYLLTNPNTTQIGVYKITKKQIAFELGFSIESVNALMDRFINNYGLIKYNNDTREICLKNWGKYNLNKLGKPMLDCVRSELKNVDDKSLLEFIKPSISKDEIVSLFDEAIYLDKVNDKDNHKYNDRYTLSTQKKKEKENIVKKINEVNNQIRLLEATFYIDYDMQDIEKELKQEINSTGVLKDLEKVEKKINELKELATEIETKKNDISLKASEYIQHIMYLPREKQDFYKKKIEDLQEKELTLKIANSDITAFLDHVQGYYRKHEKIFK